EVRKELMRAGDLITAEEAVRRVLILENPGLKQKFAITRSLYAGLQLVLPGEIAPCHRHAQSALRFVIEGEGAYTAINGEKVLMSPFDLVLTPSGLWHDHGNETNDPVVWLDGLDIPLLLTLDCGYAESYPTAVHDPTRPAGDTLWRRGRNLRPVVVSDHDKLLGDSPLFHYPYRDWRNSLKQMGQAEAPDPHDGYKLEFINPVDGTAVMKTISCFSQLIPAGTETNVRQSTDGTVGIVCEGHGTVKIGGESLNLRERDTFVVPSWSEVSFEASSDFVLFSFSDKSTQEKLGLWRELRH
ncbi:MAG: cupin domain-containing protein, partial [Pseudomonadota bacterium]